ncbi:MAG: hypothetical protein LBJ25_06405, partial [Candidatus Margulisbacteria bacterium]|nr:hypothetical protein [Candidatus Margulisiibacteriota bacterium]
LAVYNNTADAPLAAEILRDIARREAQFQEEHHDRAASMLSGYQKKIIKEILLAGYRAEERIKQLSNRAALHLAAER